VAAVLSTHGLCNGAELARRRQWGISLGWRSLAVCAVKLCIADPPYLGKAEMFYGETKKANMNVGGQINQTFKADRHKDAHLWDKPEKHEQMVLHLCQNYDGWAIAMLPTSLRHYMKWVPERTRICVWHDPRVMPTGAHPRRRWEPVLVFVPQGRRRVVDVQTPVPDVLTCPHPSGSFAGAKPPAWTRWVLDMLGYDPEQDTVDDLFPGSGSVARELAQGVLL